MSADITVNGRLWKVAVVPAEQAGTFTVTTEGTSRIVDASWIDADTVSLIDRGRAYDIRIQRRDPGSVVVELGGYSYEALIGNTRSGPGHLRAGRLSASGSSRASRRGAGVADAATGPGVTHAIKAPMPGRVVRVLVAIGDRVSARQGVVVVEAMKMENELRTPRDGTVTQIAVAAGSTVDAGAVLLVIGD